jgi:hypothetical protein
MVKVAHAHVWKFETLPDGAVRRICACGAKIVNHATNKISPPTKGYYLGRRTGKKRESSPRSRKKQLVMDDNSTIELPALLKERGLKGTVEFLRQRRCKLQNIMSITHRYLRNSESIDHAKVDEYVKMNKQLRELKIFEAELTYIKNLL